MKTPIVVTFASVSGLFAALALSLSTGAIETPPVPSVPPDTPVQLGSQPPMPAQAGAQAAPALAPLPAEDRSQMMGLLDGIKTTGNKTAAPGGDQYRLSTDILSLKDIPKSVDKRIGDLRASIKLLIRSIAEDVEKKKVTGELSLNPDGTLSYKPSEGISEQARQTVEKLINADYRNQVSISSVRVAFQMLYDINKQLMEKAEAARSQGNTEDLRNLLMLQAVYLYEMSDIVYEFMQGVELNGTATVNKIAEEYRQDIEKDMADLKKLQAEARGALDAGRLEPAFFGKQNQVWENMLASNGAEIQGWQTLTKKMGDQENGLNKARKYMDAIKFKRDTARIRLNTLKRTEVLAHIETSFVAMEDIAQLVIEMPDFPLDVSLIEMLIKHKNGGKS